MTKTGTWSERWSKGQQHSACRPVSIRWRLVPESDDGVLLASAISPHITFTWRKVGAVVMTSDSGRRESAHSAIAAALNVLRGAQPMIHFAF
jgi:hypothetical protein